MEHAWTESSAYYSVQIGNVRCRVWQGSAAMRSKGFWHVSLGGGDLNQAKGTWGYSALCESKDKAFCHAEEMAKQLPQLRAAIQEENEPKTQSSS